MMSTSALPTTLTGLLARHADAGRVALFDRDQAVSFAQLADESARIAAALRGLGVEPGDRVGLWLPNATAWLSALFACARLGAIAVAVNTRFRSAELADIVGRAGIKVLFVWPAFDKADFVGVVAGCPPAAFAALRAVIAYDEDEPAWAARSKRSRNGTSLKSMVRLAAKRGIGVLPELS